MGVVLQSWGEKKKKKSKAPFFPLPLIHSPRFLSFSHAALQNHVSEIMNLSRRQTLEQVQGSYQVLAPSGQISVTSLTESVGSSIQ